MSLGFPRKLVIMRTHPHNLTTFIVAAAAAVSLASAPLASGQYYVGPYPPVDRRTQNNAIGAGRPMSGYDPFVLNPRTGRFDYVPIPYEPEPAGPNYNPYRFNWHSGRWDYVPIPPAESNVATNLGEEASTASYAERPTVAAPAPAPQPAAKKTQQPRIIEPAAAPVPPVAPSTKPATAPARPYPPPAMRVNLAGRWEFDNKTGRWVFVLPPD